MLQYSYKNGERTMSISGTCILAKFQRPIDVFMPPRRRSVTPSQHSNHSNPSITSSVHANGVYGNGIYGNGTYPGQYPGPRPDHYAMAHDPNVIYAKPYAGKCAKT